MKKIFVLMGIFLVLTPINFYSLNHNFIIKFDYLSQQATEEEKQNSAILKEILDKTASYCEKLHDLNFTFSCTAEIEETIYHPFLASLQGKLYPHTREKNQYVYNYHFNKVDDIVDEKWILKEENGVTKDDEVPQPDLKRFYTIWPIYGPLEFLSSFWQEQYVYKIDGIKTIEDQKAYVIEAQPKSPEESDKDHFLIWVSEENFSILKIVWFQSTLDNPDVKTQYVDPRIELTAEYFIEVEEIRLPTKYSINEEYQKDEVRLKKSKTTINYKKYKFLITFQENSDVQIK
jgi:hypothetical protein